MRFLNLTRHDIVIVGPDGQAARRFPPSGQLARCATIKTPLGKWDGINLSVVKYGKVEGLPAPSGAGEERVVYLVSALVRQAVPDRLDVASPGDVITGPDGQPVGCRDLVVNEIPGEIA